MTVSVLIHAREMSVSPRLREHVEKKVGKLDRFLPNVNEVRVDLSNEKSARSAADRKVAQLTLHTRGLVLRAEERDEDMFGAVDAVVEKMERQIARYKGKHRRARGDGAGAELVAPEIEPVLVEEEAPGAIVRRKRFALTPMSEAEAIEQMQLLGHDSFFIFYNADTSRVNVLYKRNTGDFGLIDPEIG